MRLNFLTVLFSFVIAGPAFAQTQTTCPDFHMSGHWKTEEGTFFFRSFKTYEIQQQGCYVLVYDTYRRATWKIDLSGQHTIKAPPETVLANLEGAGESAAENISNVEVKVTPKGISQDGSSYAADLDSVVDLARQPSFPIDTKMRFKAWLNYWDRAYCNSCTTPTPEIQIYLKEVEILDMSNGVPQGVDKSSFISGLNTALSLFLNAFSYKMQVLTLIKD